MKTGILYVFLISLILSFAVIPPREITGAYFPFARADLEISLSKPSFNPILLNRDNFNMLLDDIDKLPTLVRETLLPQLREEFLKYEDELLNEYIAYISVLYNMEEDTMSIEIETGTERFRDQIIEEVQQAAETEMSVISQVGMIIAVHRNSGLLKEIASDLYESTMSKVEEFTVPRTEALATHGREILQAHKVKLLANTTEGDGPSAEVAISFISLKMLDLDLARVTVFHPPDEQGYVVRLIDEVKTGIRIVPEFPVNLMVITAVGLIGALVLRLNGNKIALR